MGPSGRALGPSGRRRTGGLSLARKEQRPCADSAVHEQAVYGRVHQCDAVALVYSARKTVTEVAREIGAPAGPWATVGLVLVDPVAQPCWAHVQGAPVSRSGYYAYSAARPAAEERARREDELVAEIRQVHTASCRAYGAPRITAALHRKGRRINRKRVERLMRERKIHGITRRKHRSLTKPDSKAAISPDLSGRDFTAAEPGTGTGLGHHVAADPRSPMVSHDGHRPGHA
ncbi:IS3 family transposase [Streptomyces sp. CG1]|uniref:IS3 family transposase n=1 Tax=Streptomyces sp. CG1 TaxID=1287523 RepID=UPI0034E1BFBC